MTWCLAIAVVVFLSTFWRRSVGLGLVILLWPAYLIRTTIFGVPTTALELSIYALTVASLIEMARRRDWSRLHLPRWMGTLIMAWVVAWVLATLFSTDRQASWGALKA